MRVVVDTHALIWYLSDSRRLSSISGDALDEAVRTGGIVVPTAVLFDLVYLTEKGKLPRDDLRSVREVVADQTRPVEFAPVTITVMDHFAETSSAVLADPWDRLMVATAQAMALPLVTRDENISASMLVDTIW